MYEMKVCKNCGVEKKINCFYKNSQNEDGKTIWCKDCLRKYQKKYHEENPEKDIEYRNSFLKKKYGMTIEEYNQIFLEQDEKCAICGKHFDYLLFVDHDHKTGKVRDLLCQPCNLSLGGFYDDKEILLNAVSYLERRNK